MSTEAATEWAPCEECHQPIIQHHGYKTDASYSGRHHRDQVDTGVEHECGEGWHSPY